MAKLIGALAFIVFIVIVAIAFYDMVAIASGRLPVINLPWMQ